MKLLIGLGNPGRKYKHTRHNVGEEFLGGWLNQRKLGRTKHNKKLQAQVLAGEGLVVAFPTTFMNNSGEAVQNLAHFYKINPADILLVHDDIDLELGKLRLSTGTRSGGHNGVESVMEHLGTADFSRLKIGISPTDDALRGLRQADAATFVLKKFSRPEKEALKEVFPAAMGMIDEFISS